MVVLRLEIQMRIMEIQITRLRKERLEFKLRLWQELENYFQVRLNQNITCEGILKKQPP